MPLYEYRCDGCGRAYCVLVGMTAGVDASACPQCGCERATRRITRFAARLGSSSSVDIQGPEAFGDPEDASTLRRWTSAAEHRLGEGLGEDFDEYIEAAEGDNVPD